jgi:hypothetical protein
VAAGLLLAAAAWPAPPAGATDRDPEVVISESSGRINWTQGTATGKGFAGPDLRAPSVTVSKLGAEKAAREAAATALCRLLRGALAEVASEDGLAPAAEPPAVTEHCKARARAADLKVFSDGAVWIEAQARLEIALAAWQGHPAEPASAAARGTLVITLPRSAAVVPRARVVLTGEDGQPLESPPGRIARYARTAAAARKLVSGTAHAVTALRLGPKGELVVTRAEHQKAFQALGSDLRQVRVVVVAESAKGQGGAAVP